MIAPKSNKVSVKRRPMGHWSMNQSQRGIYMALGYRSVRVLADGSITATQGAGDAHLRYDRVKLIDQSRQFMRDNAIYKGMIERAVSYIVGTGFGLQAKTGNKTVNKKLESLWGEFWVRPDIRGLITGTKIERMICREMLVCGDHGVIKTNKGKIQLIESELICGGGTEDGVRKNQFGTPTMYFVGSYTKNGYLSSKEATPYDPKYFIFLTDPERPSSTRSAPPCQASFAMLHRINDVCDSEAIAWQMLSRMAVSITRQGGAERAYGESEADTEAETMSLAQRVSEIGYAMIFNGEPGEEIKGIERNIPGSNFENSVRMFLRLLGLPLGLPLEIILLDWTKSNYSQSRAVLEQAYQSFLDRQSTQDDFLRQVYEWKVGEWIKTGEVKPRADLLDHEWIKPTFPWIDQLKEAQARGEQIDRGFATHGQICKSLNQDRDDLMDSRQAEIIDAIRRSDEIFAETKVRIPWEILAGMSPKDKSAVAKPEPDKPDNPSKETQDEE